MEQLSDPYSDRVVQEVKPPPHRPLSDEILFPKTSQTTSCPDWKALRTHLSEGGLITKAHFLKLAQLAGGIMRREPNIISVQDPVVLIGDIHGQFYDLLKILELAGLPSTNKLVFMGDYVDRGAYSCEVIQLLYAMKISYPERVILLRGNHECRKLTSFFNFRSEVLAKFDEEVYDFLMDSFNCMPLACIVNGRFFVVHGGLSPELKTIDDVSRIKRLRETPGSGSMCDILWSDPSEEEAGGDFLENTSRGCSFTYGSQACLNFLAKNNLFTVIRAHEAQLEGYRFYNWRGVESFPALITLFSAPNYCNVYKNKGAIAKISKSQLRIQQFTYSEQPYTLPDNMNLFAWSIPFMIEKVLQMFMKIAQTADDEEETPKNQEETPVLKKSLSVESPEKQARRMSLKKKVQSFSKMIVIYRRICENRETILQLKGLCPDNRLPQGLLMDGKDAILSAIEAFQKAKSWDQINERMPGLRPS